MSHFVLDSFSTWFLNASGVYSAICLFFFLPQINLNGCLFAYFTGREIFGWAIVLQQFNQSIHHCLPKLSSWVEQEFSLTTAAWEPRGGAEWMQMPCKVTFFLWVNVRDAHSAFSDELLQMGSCWKPPQPCREDHRLLLSRAIPSTCSKILVGMKSMGVFMTDFNVSFH